MIEILETRVRECPLFIEGCNKYKTGKEMCRGVKDYHICSIYSAEKDKEKKMEMYQ